jgi:hypothetical protein
MLFLNILTSLPIKTFRLFPELIAYWLGKAAKSG